MRFSALQRAEIAEIEVRFIRGLGSLFVSVLFNEPKLLKFSNSYTVPRRSSSVSVLFNEPKLLKSNSSYEIFVSGAGFSALQRAEIAEIQTERG